MELIIGFVYDVIGIRVIRKEKDFTKRLLMILGFSIVGFLLIVVLLSL